MIWIAQILVARVANKMGMFAMVKARGMLLTKVVDWIAKLRFRLPPNTTISPADCILFQTRGWSGVEIESKSVGSVRSASHQSKRE